MSNPSARKSVLIYCVLLMYHFSGLRFVQVVLALQRGIIVMLSGGYTTCISSNPTMPTSPKNQDLHLPIYPRAWKRMLQETLRHCYNRPQSFAPKFHQVPAIFSKICQEKRNKDRETNTRYEEESHLDGKTPSAIDTFLALNVCFENMSWVICEIDKRSFIYGSNNK